MEHLDCQGLPYHRSNRTFMELKFISTMLSLRLFLRSNRTFMKLKFSVCLLSSNILAVLIVPLWNWNVDLLRYGLDPTTVLIVPLWNWNFRSKSDIERERLRSNRTFMELKSAILILKCITLLIVLIVPLWNWNFLLTLFLGKGYSSNRTFMELKSLSDLVARTQRMF